MKPDYPVIAQPRYPRLIDQGSFFHQASLAGQAERYKRGKTTHTIHVWWARRPHSAMLPLVFASLNKSGISTQLHHLSLDMSASELEAARRALADDYPDGATLLDPFGGGGTIPQAGASLGVRTTALDINPLSVFIQRCYLTYLPQVNEPAEQVAVHGRKLLKELSERTSDLFPTRSAGVIGYLWNYRGTCGSCNKDYVMSKRPWVSKKLSNKPTRGSYLALSPEMELVKVAKKNRKSYQQAYEQQSVLTTQCCPHCGESLELDFSRLKDQPVVKISTAGYRQGKEFEIVDQSLPDLGEREEQLLRQLAIDQDQFPDIPPWSGITNPTIYGMRSYYDIFNTRQRVVMLELLLLLGELYRQLSTESVVKARAVVGILSSLVDQLVDWNCRLTMWISENLQPGRAFSGPGVPMYWDYCEIDPLADGPANLHGKLDRVLSGLASLDLTQPVRVDLGKAQLLNYQDDSFDAVVTDPPYYDNLYYSILSDFIYSWKYQLFRTLLPVLFTSNSTADPLELVASSQRQGDPKAAHDFYSSQMAAALQEVARVLRPDGVLSFVYSHSSFLGWLAIAEAFTGTELIICSVQPLVIERKARPRGMVAGSVDGSLVIIARPQSGVDHEQISWSSVEQKLRTMGTQQQQILEPLGFSSWDIGLTIFATGLSLVTNLKQHPDRLPDQLEQIHDWTQELIPQFSLRHRKSI